MERSHTGSIVPIYLVNLAKRNGIKWAKMDPDEAKYSGVTGTEMDIIGQETIWVSVTTLKKAKELKVLVCKQQADKLLVDLDSSIEWNIVLCHKIKERKQRALERCQRSQKMLSW